MAEIKLTIAKVKHITNLAGIIMISGAINTHRKIKNAAIPNAMSAPIKCLLLGRKLKIDSHPCGSGSGRPITKFLAPCNAPVI